MLSCRVQSLIEGTYGPLYLKPMVWEWEYQIFKYIPIIEESFIIFLVNGNDLLVQRISSMEREKILRNFFGISSHLPIKFGHKECNYVA